MASKGRVLWIISRRVTNKFPHYKSKQVWAITRSLYNKRTKRKLRGAINA
jgi:hypothetical protein